MQDISTVFRLVPSRYPFAIFGSVIAVVVATFDAVAGWTFPHVSEKFFERKPAVANLNTSSTVVFIRFGIWVSTAGFHRAPNAIRRSMFFAVRFSTAPPFLTTARLAVSTGQIAHENGAGSSAVTEASPISLTISRISRFDCCKPSKTLVSEVARRVHWNSEYALVNIVKAA